MRSVDQNSRIYEIGWDKGGDVGRWSMIEKNGKMQGDFPAILVSFKDLGTPSFFQKLASAIFHFENDFAAAIQRPELRILSALRSA